MYLAPHESSYVEFLKVRHIDVKELRVNIGVGNHWKARAAQWIARLETATTWQQVNVKLREENSEDERWDEEKDVDDINSCDDPVVSRSMTSSDAAGERALRCTACSIGKNREAMEKGTRLCLTFAGTRSTTTGLSLDTKNSSWPSWHDDGPYLPRMQRDSQSSQGNSERLCREFSNPDDVLRGQGT